MLGLDGLRGNINVLLLARTYSRALGVVLPSLPNMDTERRRNSVMWHCRISGLKTEAVVLKIRPMALMLCN